MEPDPIYFQKSTCGRIVAFCILRQAVVHKGCNSQSRNSCDCSCGNRVRLGNRREGKRPWRACLDADCGHSGTLIVACTKSGTIRDVLQRTKTIMTGICSVEARLIPSTTS